MTNVNSSSCKIESETYIGIVGGKEGRLMTFEGNSINADPNESGVKVGDSHMGFGTDHVYLGPSKDNMSGSINLGINKEEIMLGMGVDMSIGNHQNLGGGSTLTIKPSVIAAAILLPEIGTTTEVAKLVTTFF